MSDWGALHAGYEAADAGLDMVMPTSGGFWGSNLSIAVANSSFEQSRLDDMATRIFAVWKKFGSIPNPSFGDPPTTDWSLPHKHTQAMNASSRNTVFEGAVEGHVLVKNADNALPLKKSLVLSLFGYDALPPAVVDPVASLKWKFGYETLNASEASAASFIDGTWSNGSLIWPNGPLAGYAGTLITGGGSSTSNPSYIVSPYAAFAEKAREDLTMLSWNFQDQDPGVLGSSDACIVLVNEFSSEGFDRGGLADPWSDTLITNVANKCTNTIMVIHNAGIRVVDAWIDHSNITAVIMAHLPGQEAGSSLVDIMYGSVSPSGRLPYTVPKKASDFGHLLEPVHADATSDYYTQANFTEGVYIDYKHFIKNGVTPRYEFGFGLTYTDFNYSHLTVSLRHGITTSSVNAYTGVLNIARSKSAGKGKRTSETRLPWGGAAHLWDVIADVSVVVENIGKYSASEVAQLYIGIPGAPEKQLRGYQRKPINPGQKVTDHFEINRRDMSVWNTVAQSWDLHSGDYNIYVGKSVLDTPLTATIMVE